MTGRVSCPVYPTMCMYYGNNYLMTINVNRKIVERETKAMNHVACCNRTEILQKINAALQCQSIE